MSIYRVFHICIFCTYIGYKIYIEIKKRKNIDAVISMQYTCEYLKSHLTDDIEVTSCASVEKKRVSKIANDLKIYGRMLKHADI